MITITDIVGETINLRNGKETPRGLLVTNGISTALLHVSDDDLQKIIEMWAEMRSYSAGQHLPPEEEEVRDPTTIPTAPARPSRVAAPSMFNPDQDVDEEDDYDAGETYDGVKSI